MIIFLNGPPGCGKDTVGRILERDHGAILYKVAAPLRAALCGLLGIEDTEVELVKGGRFTTGATGRDLMIGISEDVVKPLLGHDWFGRKCGRQIAQDAPALAVVTDAGFRNEVAACMAAADMPASVWRIQRPGCSFAGDSRGWVSVNGAAPAFLYNTGTVEELRPVVGRLLQDICQ